MPQRPVETHTLRTKLLSTLFEIRAAAAAFCIENSRDESEFNDMVSDEVVECVFSVLVDNSIATPDMLSVSLLEMFPDVAE